ncbi:GDSL-type esterase/lipase family protein [Litorihabitans aurantiacus]|uniref:GDSL-type esterase/lipase family protein n=1 Tax=Litorihabitans aurantiacus TaxID=1930061 RepID=UPI003D665D2C
MGGRGGPDSDLGLPTNDSSPASDGAGSWQRFENGTLFSSPDAGTHPVGTGFLPAYQARGTEGGALGYPTGSETAVTGGSAQTFQGGDLYWSSDHRTVAAMTPGDIRARWSELGGPDSPLGLPTGEKVAQGRGSYQLFDGGVITWFPGIGAKVVDHESFTSWQRDPSLSGWPVSDGWSSPRGHHVQWQLRTTITRDGRTSSDEEIGSGTAVLLCDSQCAGDRSWPETGARAAGFDRLVERSWGGIGYAVGGELGTSMTDALASGRVLLPEGDPGVVVVTLGGNDAGGGRSDQQIIEQVRALVGTVRSHYPDSPIVVNGVMSRSGPEHDRRRQVDRLVTQEAASLGVGTISVAGWGDDVADSYADGVHLSQQGHDAVGARYGQALRSALR